MELGMAEIIAVMGILCGAITALVSIVKKQYEKRIDDLKVQLEDRERSLRIFEAKIEFLYDRLLMEDLNDGEHKNRH